MGEVRDIIRLYASKENVEIPDWFDFYIEKLARCNQIVFFEKNGIINGFVTFIRYGPKSFSRIKRAVVDPDGLPKGVQKGDYAYIPLSVYFDKSNPDKCFQNTVNKIVERVPSIKEVTLHNSDGEFIRVKIEKRGKGKQHA